MKHVVIAAALAAAVFGSTPASARSNELSGICTIEGTYRIERLDDLISPFTFDGQGSCIGTLNDEPSADLRFKVHVSGTVMMTTESIPVIARGTGHVMFGPGVKIDILADGWAAAYTVKGRDGGIAVVAEEALTPEQPSDPSEINVHNVATVFGLRG